MPTITLKLHTVHSTDDAKVAAIQTKARMSLSRRPLAQRLELAAVLILLGSSAAYALFALAHLAG